MWREVDRPGAARFNGFAGRVHPVAELGIRYPLVRELRNGPARRRTARRPDRYDPALNTSKIPNEDSVEFGLDDANLFSANRYPGRDRVDDDSRFVYGVNATFLGNRGGQSELFLGQNIRLSGSGSSPAARASAIRCPTWSGACGSTPDPISTWCTGSACAPPVSGRNATK